MLKKLNRLTKDKEFENVFKKGGSAYGKNLGIRAVKNNLEINRFGIVVGTKISKKAVERNKIKRQIREVLRLNLGEIKPGHDIVVITLPEILGKKYQEIELSLNKILKKLNLI